MFHTKENTMTIENSTSLLKVNVIRRNGEKAPLDITKIRNVIQNSTKGLDADALKLEASLEAKLIEGVKTKDIQDNLIESSLKMCNLQEPDWRYVAGRLEIWSLIKDVRVSRSFGYGDYYKSVCYQIENNRYSEDILIYTREELEEAGTWINTELDWDYDYAGAAKLLSRYLLKDELIQEAFLTCALLIARVEKFDRRLEIAKEIYEAIAKRKISLATPILANLRKPNGSLSSCFIISSGDSLESIFNQITNTAKISKAGGGIGVNLSNVRAAGSYVMSRANSSGGVIPWIKLFNDTAIAVNQG